MKTGFVLALLLPGAAMAQSPGTFTATGNMTAERIEHTATLLTNGRVLIAGGWAIVTSASTWASAELYDPSTGAFTATGSMTKPRTGHTATLLPDGRVLVAGGESDVASNPRVYSALSSALASSELYDPSTGEFTPTGNMTTSRVWHTATLLNNGKVLIAGGFSPRGNNCCIVASAELYDPSTGTFSETGSMATFRAEHTATLLSQGEVLMHGPNAIAELYDPATGTFNFTGTSAYNHLDLSPGTASLLPNGKVLTTFGDSYDFDYHAELYDSATGTFIATGNMTTSRLASTSTLLPDGTVLIAGRYDDRAPNYGGSAELYDSGPGTFSNANGLMTQREEGHKATLLPDGTVLMSGGRVCCGLSITTAEIYYPALLVRSPVLFSLSGDGLGQGAILHADTHQVVSSSNPAVVGEALEIYCTGLADGSVIPPQVGIGGRMAEVLFFGKAPGFTGLNQVNVQVPTRVGAGPAVPVRMNYFGRPSNEVTIGVQ
jgi:hypothetical protein